MTKKPWFWAIFIGISLLLIAVGLYLLLRPDTFTIVTSDVYIEHKTHLTEPGQILTEAGIPFHPQDRILPPLGSFIEGGGYITVQSAVWVQVWEDGEMVYEVYSADRLPAQHLLDASVQWTTASRLLWNGEAVDIDTELPAAEAYILEITRSTGETVLESLWADGVNLSNVDELSRPWYADATSDMNVKTARPISVQVDGQTVTGFSGAETVGEALNALNLSLQALDRTQPALTAPIPEDGKIQIFRRHETVELQSTYTGYGSQMQPDPELALDGRSLISPGQSGVQVSRVRSIYEDGQLLDTVTDATWQASTPQDEIIGYGQLINTWTIDSEYGPLEVYREVSMYATSYHPCAFSDGCHYTTRNGCTLEKGVVAVAAEWYPYMVGQYVYIPGYGKGVVCDSGWGIEGRYWIDLGYADEDFINWHSYVPVYFLTPVPETVLWVLP